MIFDVFFSISCFAKFSLFYIKKLELKKFTLSNILKSNYMKQVVGLLPLSSQILFHSQWKKIFVEGFSHFFLYNFCWRVEETQHSMCVVCFEWYLIILIWAIKAKKVFSRIFYSRFACDCPSFCFVSLRSPKNKLLGCFFLCNLFVIFFVIITHIWNHFL